MTGCRACNRGRHLCGLCCGHRDGARRRNSRKRPLRKDRGPEARDGWRSSGGYWRLRFCCLWVVWSCIKTGRALWLGNGERVCGKLTLPPIKWNALIDLQKLLLMASWSWVSMPPIRSLFVHHRAEAGASGAFGLRNGPTSQYPRASIRLPFSIRSLSPFSFRCRCPTIFRHLSCPISFSACPLYQRLLYRSRTGPMDSILSIGWSL